MKIYNKRGNLAYKERRVVAQIEEAIAKKLKENPNFQFEPANNLDELQQLHSKLCIDDVAFTEIPHPSSDNAEPNTQEKSPEVPKSETTEASESTENVADPFNRDEAFVRGYVKGTDFPGDKVENLNPNATFGEPQTSKSAFEMPPENADEQQPGSSGKSPKNDNKTNEPKSSQAKIVNPNTSEASPSEKRKNTKKMAKVIVLLVTGLWQKGMLFWSTKNVNDMELRRMHESGEIDMINKIQLPEGDEVTISDFFMSQSASVQEAIEITQEEKDRLTESLTAVMVKKGIEPTDEQMLILDMIEILGIKTLQVYAIKSSLDAVLEQLKIQNAPNFAISREHGQAITREQGPEAPIVNNEKAPTESNLEVITEK